MELNNANYELTAVKPEQYPKSMLPEIACVGRSNVGKSSTINTLLNRKNLARVGSKPGKTREINFYNIDKKLYLVDLPGYGYASVSKAEKESWGQIVETYLFSRQQLKTILMLVDIRHTPSKEDVTMYNWILNYSKCVVIATKADKIPKAQINIRLMDIKNTLCIEGETMPIAFSSETKIGKDEVWNRIKQAVFSKDLGN